MTALLATGMTPGEFMASWDTLDAELGLGGVWPEGIAFPGDLGSGPSRSEPSVFPYHIPKGFHISGSIDLADRTMTHLPAGLIVHGFLSLNWSCVKALPAALRVDGDLYVERADAWDGRIPDDAIIGGRIYTVDFPCAEDEEERLRFYPESIDYDNMGLTLDEFRAGGPHWK